MKTMNEKLKTALLDHTTPNQRIKTLFTQVEPLDMYTQLAIYGGWQYMINSACINAAMRFIPKDTVNEGGTVTFADGRTTATAIDGVSQYDAGRRKAMQEADTSNLPSLLNLQREISNATAEAGGDVRDISNTLDFRLKNIPKMEESEREFENRRRAGKRPGISRADFTAEHYKEAMQRHALLTSQGEDAVRLCNTLSFKAEEEGDEYNNLPEWVEEGMTDKLIEKLHARWNKLEFRRTNLRLRQAAQDDAETDQLLITGILAEYGEVPGISTEAEAAEDQDWLTKAEAESMAKAPPKPAADPKAPGEVTVIRP